jgi:hypothetical protein
MQVPSILSALPLSLCLQEEVLVRYLSDSLKMVEQVMVDGGRSSGARAQVSHFAERLRACMHACMLVHVCVRVRVCACVCVCVCARSDNDAGALQQLRYAPPGGNARRASSEAILDHRPSDGWHGGAQPHHPGMPGHQWPAPTSEIPNKLRSSMQAGSMRSPHNLSATGPSGSGGGLQRSPSAGRMPTWGQTDSRGPVAGPARPNATVLMGRTGPETAQGLGRPPPGQSPRPMTGQQERQYAHQLPPQGQAQSNPRAPASEAGTNDGWWRPGSGRSSVGSYPMTAVTDRNCGSVASTEFRAWMDRLNKLESAVQDERSKRRQFEEELKKIQGPSGPRPDSMFQVSQGQSATPAGGMPPRPVGRLMAQLPPAAQAAMARQMMGGQQRY